MRAELKRKNGAHRSEYLQEHEMMHKLTEVTPHDRDEKLIETGD